MRRFGLIGFPLTHSFSKKYFAEKFKKEGIQDCQYDLYEISDISMFPKIISDNPDLEGINVTIPYKEKIIPYLDKLDPACATIGAVNCIKFSNGKLIGYNTDYLGFKASLNRWIDEERPKALILGSGGASKAVEEALIDLKITYLLVSRSHSEKENHITYTELANDPVILKSHLLIINTTPLGTFPKTEEMPAINQMFISKHHMIYDLVYNPEKTLFMKTMQSQGARVKNGLEMLHLQAEAAWEIWN